MSDFNRIYKSILTEGRIPSIFKKATPEEVAERKTQYAKIQSDEWVEKFMKRKDIKKNKDGSWDVDGNVIMKRNHFTKIPIKFNRVWGYFWCFDNALTSLENCPVIVGESFDCAENKLTSLEHCAKKVGTFFSCSLNYLTSLDHCPTHVGGNFYCRHQYTSVEFTRDDVESRCKVGKGIFTKTLID